MPTFKELRHEYDTTRGLWCIDRKPEDVDYDWIKRNAFELKDYLGGPDEESTGVTVGGFTLRQGTTPAKIWIGGPSGKGTEVDGKVIEDILKSFF